MLNAIGLANPGRERFLAETLPRLRELGVPLWVSVGGFCGADYAETCARRSTTSRRSSSTSRARTSTRRPRRRPRSSPPAARRPTLPLYAKLSPARPDIAEVARAVEAAGADGLSLVNTMRGLALDERTLQPVLARGAGGYSGTGAEADRARRRLRVLPRDGAADRRHGRRRDRTRRARAVACGAATSRSARCSSPTPTRRRASERSWRPSCAARLAVGRRCGDAHAVGNARRGREPSRKTLQTAKRCRLTRGAGC